MRITSPLLNLLHLDPRQLLMSARSVKVIHTLFTMLDVEDQVSYDSRATPYVSRNTRESLSNL